MISEACLGKGLERTGSFILAVAGSYHGLHLAHELRHPRALLFGQQMTVILAFLSFSRRDILKSQRCRDF